MIKLTPALLALALFTSCLAPQPKAPLSEALWESLQITTAEPYEHSESGTVFPTHLAKFERQRVVQYDVEAYDIAIGYEQQTPEGTITVTLYLYPNQIGTTKAAMERATAGILRANPGSEIHSEGISPLVPGKAGLQVTVTSPRTSAFGDTTVVSEAHVFVLDTIWLFKVRASYSPELWEVAQVELKRMMSELKLPDSRHAK